MFLFFLFLLQLVMVPLITGMGLIFKDIFEELHFPKRDASIIMSINMSFGMLMGLTHGPLLRMFGYRKIALAGSTMFVSGLLMTGFSRKFTHFLISHGFVTCEYSLRRRRAVLEGNII